MKPYGQKKQKSKLGTHSSDNCGCEGCNTSNWKIMKSRERDLPEFDEIIDDIQYLEMMKNCDAPYWVACYKPLGISVIGKTKEDCLKGIEDDYNTHK